MRMDFALLNDQFLEGWAGVIPPGYSATGNGAPADGENRPGQQDRGVFPNGLGKKRLKPYDKWQQLDRHCSHIEDIFWRRILL